MGRSITRTGRGRSRTGATGKKQRRAGAGAGRTGESTGRAGQTNGTGDTGESTGGSGPLAAVVGIVATDHQIAPEQPMDLLLTQDTAAPEPIPDNLAAEAAAAIGQAPVDPALAPEPPAYVYDPDKVTEWDMYMQLAVNLIAKVALPQWNLTDDEKNELTKSTAHILEDLFPGGLSGRYAPYLRLIVVSGVIVITRAKEHDGKLPGLGPKPEPKADVVAQQ